MGVERRSSIGISSSRGRRILSNKQNILEILAILVVTICVTFAGAEQQQQQQQQQREILQQSISPKQNGFTKQQQHDLFLQSSDSDSISDVLDRTNGAQFVALFDPLMEGRITGIMDRFRTKYPDSVWRRLLELPSRNFLQALDGLSGGRLTMLFNAYSPSRARRAPLDTMSGMSLGNAKRSSLDPMNGLSFGAPASKRNFDEIDRMGFSGFAKRFADFDEIDRAGFSGFSKRKSSSDFDEIDRAGFSGFAKKRFADFDEIDRAGFSGFAKKRFNFDELDRVGFNGFTKRQAQNPLISMMRANSIKLSPSKAQQSSEISNKQ